MLRVALLCLLVPGAAMAQTVTVFAASSLKTALDRAAPAFEGATGYDLRLVYAGSSALARQIGAGAPADVFVSANSEWMDAVADRVIPGTRRDLLGNALVLIGRTGPEVALDAGLLDRLGSGRLAMALTEAVPAGIYGRAAFEALDLWGALAPRVAEVDNVRAALALVAIGAAPLGVVYATDAAAEPRVRVLARFDPALHPSIRYPAAAIDGGGDGAIAFLDYLEGPEASEIFAAEGFEVLE